MGLRVASGGGREGGGEGGRGLEGGQAGAHVVDDLSDAVAGWEFASEGEEGRGRGEEGEKKGVRVKGSLSIDVGAAGLCLVFGLVLRVDQFARFDSRRHRQKERHYHRFPNRP